MKYNKTLVGALVACGFGIMAQSVSATLFVDVDTRSGLGKELTSNAPTTTGNFNIAQVTGVNPVAYPVINETLSWATVSFLFNDVFGVASSVNVALGNGPTTTSFVSNFQVPLYLNGFTSGFVSGNAWGDLTADGKLKYTVTLNVNGTDTVYFKTATLYAVSTPNAQVPDGGATLALFGLGVMGVGCLARKSRV
jgi:hypothetical protein